MTTERELELLAAIALKDEAILQMRKEAESYGEAWARANVREFRELLPVSAKEKFDLLAIAQTRLNKVAEALAIQPDATALAEYIEPLVKALEGWMGVAQNCAIESGFCCCGESMNNHSHPMMCGHSPVDMADQVVPNLIKQTEEALASFKGEQK